MAGDELISMMTERVKTSPAESLRKVIGILTEAGSSEGFAASPSTTFCLNSEETSSSHRTDDEKEASVMWGSKEYREYVRGTASGTRMR
jgi:hypothetical protein